MNSRSIPNLSTKLIFVKAVLGAAGNIELIDWRILNVNVGGVFRKLKHSHAPINQPLKVVGEIDPKLIDASNDLTYPYST